MKRLSMLFLASVCIGLAGCQLAPLAIQGAAQAGARANASNMQASTDADKLTVELAAPTTEKVFIQTAKTVVGRLDYQTTNVGSGMVMAQKRFVDRAITVFGKTEYQTTT
ncbi:MAG TPA: hypothetical protein VEU32_02950, partial [Burkholderiales bacterium]|nr:hypothetical protein [Burkholderiales bacterium]